MLSTLRQSVPVLVAVSLVAVVFVGGCTYQEWLVRKTAAREHDCPRPRIDIVSKNWKRDTFEIQVCGERRTYRDMGAGDNHNMVDVTDGHAPDSLDSKTE